MVHDTVTVFCFFQKILNEYVNSVFDHVHKVLYFSDGSGVQYKNFKNFTNLLLHEQDFNLKAEWHFFTMEKCLWWYNQTSCCPCKFSEVDFEPNSNTTTAIWVCQCRNSWCYIYLFLSAQNMLTNLPNSYNPDFWIHPSSKALVRTTNWFLLVTIYRWVAFRETLEEQIW